MKTEPNENEQVRLIRRNVVCERLGISEATLSRLQKTGRFPKSIRISARAVAWDERAIAAYVAGCAAGR